MRTYQIEFVQEKVAQLWVPLPDAYTFVPKGRSRWWQRQAWKFLRWCGALEQARELKIKVTRHVVNPDGFMEALYTQQRQLYDLFGKEASRLLIGSDDYSRLMCDPGVIGHGFNFDAQYSTARKVCGLTVEVIPWMRGMLVMP